MNNDAVMLFASFLLVCAAVAAVKFRRVYRGILVRDQHEQDETES